jgi:uncharacterized integral membrane protein
MQRIKTVLIASVTLLVVVVAFQNREETPTHILFATVTMPRAFLLFATLLIGFALGLLSTLKLGRSKDKSKK